MALLPVSDAQERLLALATPLSLEHVPVEDAIGRYLAEPLVARRHQPPADLSAMDGYAMRQADLPGPWHVIGESACGHPFTADIGPGQAVRIATGALMPDGADMVLMQEDATRNGTSLKLTGEPPAPLDRHIRRGGNDFTAGELLLPQGTRIGPAQIALVLAAGARHVAVHRIPRVTVIDSGDELSSDPENCARHQIPASNGAMLSALLRQTIACEVKRIGPVPDNVDALLAALAQCANSDVIVTSGGASVGDHDLIRPALTAWGAQLAFWKVAMKPGKPIMAATREQQLVIGLPGNPVSSHVTAYLFLLPLLRALGGAANCLPRPIIARTAESLPAGGARQEFIRAKWDGEFASAKLNQDSGAIRAMAHANAIIARPINAPPAEPGAPISLYLLENGGIA